MWCGVWCEVGHSEQKRGRGLDQGGDWQLGGDVLVPRRAASPASAALGVVAALGSTTTLADRAREQGNGESSTMFVNSDLPPEDGTTHDQTNPNTPGNWLENELVCHPKHPLACSSGGVGEGGHPRPPSQLNPSGRGETPRRGVSGRGVDNRVLVSRIKV